MASVLHDKPTRDAAVAVAILWLALCLSRGEAEDASELLEGIQGHAQRFVSSWINDEKPNWLN